MHTIGGYLNVTLTRQTHKALDGGQAFEFVYFSLEKNRNSHMVTEVTPYPICRLISQPQTVKHAPIWMSISIKKVICCSEISVL